MSRRVVGLALAGAVAGIVLWLWPRGPKDPEAEVRKLVAEVVAGCEARDVGPLSDSMAEEFKGPQGASKQEVKQIVAFQVLRGQGQAVSIFNPTLDVTLQGPDLADISGTFLFTRSKVKSAEEATADVVASAYKIEASLERRGSDWKFVSAKYQPISWP